MKLLSRTTKALMGTVLALAVIAAAAPVQVHADPHLTCDVYKATDGVTGFELTIDGSTITTTAMVTDTAKGTVTLWYDLAAIQPGTHTVTGKVCNSWGCSDSSGPFVFSRPQPLAPPKNFILGK